MSEVKKLKTKIFPVIIEVDALECDNLNFTPNTHAVELVGELIRDAKLHCLRLINQSDKYNFSDESKNTLQKYLERKYATYEKMEESLIKNQK